MLKKLISVLICVLIAISSINCFAFNVKITNNTSEIVLSGNIGGNKNNRTISLFTNETGFTEGEIDGTENLRYVGCATVDYDGGFSTTLPSDTSFVYMTSDEVTILKSLKNIKSLETKMEIEYPNDSNDYIITADFGSSYASKKCSAYIFTDSYNVFNMSNNAIYTATGTTTSGGSVSFKVAFNPQEEFYNFAVKCDDITVSNRKSISELKAEQLNENDDIFGLSSQYPEIKGTNTKERFFERVAELPDEIPVIMPKTVEDGKYTFFVDPSKGNDKNSGDINSPFATIRKALYEVSKIDYSEKKSGVTVYLRGGEYKLDYAINMYSEHSGTPEAPLYISSYKGEKVTVQTGKKISGASFKGIDNFEMLTRLNPLVRNKVYCVDLEEVGINDYGKVVSRYKEYLQPKLYCEDAEMRLARYPNTGTVRVGKVINPGAADETNESPDGISFTFLDDRPLGWKDTGDIAICGGIGWEWSLQNVSVSSIDKANHVLISDDNPQWGVMEAENRTTAAPTTYYYYNVFEELDTAGEWYLDRNEGKLYVYPEKNIEECEFYYALGDVVPLTVNQANNVVLNGIEFCNGSSDGLILNGCKNVIIQNCKISNFTSNGVLINDCLNSGLTTCEIYNTEQYGIYITKNSDEYQKLIPCRNFVQNCSFTRQENTSQRAGVITKTTVGNIISHNFFQNFSANAICPEGAENIVEYNEISGACRDIRDMGAIYWAGMFNRGTHIRYNYIHDPALIKKAGHAVYMDQMGSDCYVYGNVVDGFNTGFYTHGGRDIAVYNNVFVNSQYPGSYFFLDSGNYYEHYSNLFQENMTPEGYIKAYTSGFIDLKSVPWKTRYPNFYEYILKVDQYLVDKETEGYSWDYKWLDSDGNVQNEAEVRAPSGHYIVNNVSYGNTGIRQISIGTKTACATEPNLITSEDPGFVDFDNENYTLVPNKSITDTLDGFVAPPFEKMGLVTHNTEWEAHRNNSLEGIYPVNGEMTSASEANFNWTTVPFSNYYNLTVAKDRDFSEIVYELKTSDSVADFNGLDSDTQYYWKVTSHTNFSLFKDSVIESPVYTFNTMNLDMESQVMAEYRGNYLTYTAGTLSEADIQIIKDVSAESNNIKITYDVDFSQGEDDSCQSISIGGGYKVVLNKDCTAVLYKDGEEVASGNFKKSNNNLYHTIVNSSYTEDKVVVELYVAADEGGDVGTRLILLHEASHSGISFNPEFLTSESTDSIIGNVRLFSNHKSKYTFEVGNENGVNTVVVYNNTSSAIENAEIIVAVYDDNGVYKNSVLHDIISVPANGNTEKYIVNLTDISGKQIRIYLWEKGSARPIRGIGYVNYKLD